eukprot:TRINITY_DN16580_c0_g1_i1.p1 TRINITY_DN16580_c0_g1~~TRINITY_DN16580_c0_g1_i1.p1  ORF type:complete len:443 (+),score=179.72 TRINITY_DN16580_c0_g1_i1:63-1391(+)
MPGKKKDKKSNEPEPLKPDDAEYDRESLKVKISTYEMKIMRLHKDNTELKQVAAKAQTEMSESSTESLEMFQRLTDRMDAKDKDIAKIRAELAQAEDQKNGMETELRNQIQAERDEKEASVEKLTRELNELQHQLDEVEQFRLQKDQTAKKIEDLERDLSEAKVIHNGEIERLKASHKEDRESLRNDMIKKWRQTRLEVYKLTEDHLQTKTQETIQENEKLTRDLDMYSREAKDMMTLNGKLKDENTSLKRSLEIEQRGMAELMKKSQQQQRTIKNLVAKVKSCEEVYKHSQSEKDDEKAQRIVALGETIDNQYDTILDLKRELDEANDTSRTQQREYLAAARDAQGKMASLTEAQQFLLQCVEDVKKEAGCSHRGQSLLGMQSQDRVEAVAYIKRRLDGFDTGFCPRPPLMDKSDTISSRKLVGMGPAGATKLPLLPQPPS